MERNEQADWLDIELGGKDMGQILAGYPDYKITYEITEGSKKTSQEEFLERYDKRKAELRKTLETKGNDYSGDVDRHANFKVFHFMTQGRPVVVTPLISCLIRQLDKIQRAINLHINGQAYVKGETMADTLKDNSGYSDIAEDIWAEEIKKE